MTQQRLHLQIQGAVQGVGFRPFVFRLATSSQLSGWVRNDTQGVVIEVEGNPHRLNQFLSQLQQNSPVLAIIEAIEQQYVQPLGEATFAIHPSYTGPKSVFLLPDIATCADCLHELFDPSNRRYHYPFINCTHCGPRFSIIQALPYDRDNTAMRGFQMCPDCLSEYQDPSSRRFHAQPIACSVCGPWVELWDGEGGVVRGMKRGEDGRRRDEPIRLAAEAIRQGKVIAVKGLGGFHLMVDARNPGAVARLREHKNRPDKPLALMYPSLELVRKDCEVSELEAELLRLHHAPIVLLKRRQQYRKSFRPGSSIADTVAPGSPHLGILLPYTPLHHLLMAELNFPIVATSGNPNGAPICFDEQQALHELKTIADLYLIHNRPILHPIDDSIVQVINNQPQLRRRARGYAPLPISFTPPSFPLSLNGPAPETPPSQDSKFLLGRRFANKTQNLHSPTILALGPHLKNTIALSLGNRIFISQHLGDLGTAPSLDRFQQTIHDFLQLYECQPDVIACDAHPDYASTQAAQAFAQQWQIPVIPVQHHYAHVLACMAEHHLEAPVLGIAWDGAGYGLDGTLWGGEFLRITPSGFEQVGYLRPFQLPGGEQATREPRRSALGLLYTCFGEEVFEWGRLAPLNTFSKQSEKVLRAMLDRQLNTPLTSSMGRLFDAIASLTNLIQTTNFEGQAAMALESILASAATGDHYPFQVSTTLPLVVDWEPMLTAILADIYQEVDISLISAKFHHTLVAIIVQIAEQIGEPCIVLTGGCFQNQYLSERAIHRLQEKKFRPYWHQQVPANDGGIALGQVMAVHRHPTGRFSNALEADSACV